VTTRETWVNTLCRLVEVGSVTGSELEAAFPRHLQALLSEQAYFAAHPDAITLHPTGDGREVLTALFRPAGPRRTDTVVLLAHYDVVGVEDYGPRAALAFSPVRLTGVLREHPQDLPPDARQDLHSGRFLFGRGVMDMKAGLASEVALLEEAGTGTFRPEGNLLLLAVPDEEVNSVGMRSALDALLDLARAHDLIYRLVLNTEPVFPRLPGDRQPYLYTGSMGKILAGFYCLGQVSHVGESLSGLNANTMAAALTMALEWHPALVQHYRDETTPPPTNLLQFGLSERYSVQMPFRAVTLTNVLTYDRPLADVLAALRFIAEHAASRLMAEYQEAVHRAGAGEGAVRDIRVWTWQDLRRAAESRVGTAAVASAIAGALASWPGDERARAVGVVDTLAALIPAEAPLMVLFLAPPYYPAVNFSEQPLVSRVVDAANRALTDAGLLAYRPQAFYGGLSDLSFVGDPTPPAVRALLEETMPGWGTLYDIPLSAGVFRDTPGLNIGPIGFDAHQATERVDVDFAVAGLLPALRAAVREALTAVPG
jgi:arginine utilization protein RocB